MQIVQIQEVRPVTAAFVALTFWARMVKGQPRVLRQVILPTLTAPGVGELAVYLSNTEDRPDWMKSPLLCYHGRGEAMGRTNQGGLYPCKEWPSTEADKPSRYSLIFARMTDDPLMQEYVQDGLDVTEFYMGGAWTRALA